MDIKTFTPFSPFSDLVTSPLVSFHGKPEVKEKYLARMRSHHSMDQIRQGLGGYYYTDEGDSAGNKGCVVGCTLHDASHRGYEVELGYPVALAHIIEAVFERIPAIDAPGFALATIEKVPVGHDLSPVVRLFFDAILDDPVYGFSRFCPKECDIHLNFLLSMFCGEGDFCSIPEPPDFQVISSKSRQNLAPYYLEMRFLHVAYSEVIKEHGKADLHYLISSSLVNLEYLHNRESTGIDVYSRVAEMLLFYLEFPTLELMIKANLDNLKEAIIANLPV